MRPTRVVLAGEVHAALLALGRGGSGPEPVALLGGRRCGDETHVVRCAPLPNLRIDADSFAVSAAAFAAGEAGLRADGLDWLGFAHAHRGGCAAPSAADHASLWRGCVQVVVGADGVRAFWFAGDTCLPLPLQVAEVPA
jgi:hypothetical protein